MSFRDVNKSSAWFGWLVGDVGWGFSLKYDVQLYKSHDCCTKLDK